MINFILWLLMVIGGWVINKLLDRAFMNRKSPFYYEKLMERLKLFMYNTKIALMTTGYVVLMKLRIIKPLTSGQTFRLAVIIIVAAILTTMIIVVNSERNKKKLTT